MLLWKQPINTDELEIWLKQQSCNDKIVRGQTPKARTFLRSELRNKQKGESNESRFVFNIKNYSAFGKFRTILPEIHELRTK